MGRVYHGHRGRRRGAEGALQRRRRLVGQWKHKLEWASNGWPGKGNAAWAVFSFLYLKKIKISKIYVRFGNFQKYTPVALWGATGLKCNVNHQILRKN